MLFGMTGRCVRPLAYEYSDKLLSGMFNAANLIHKLAIHGAGKEEPDKQQGLSGSDESFELVTTSLRDLYLARAGSRTLETTASLSG